MNKLNFTTLVLQMGVFLSKLVFCIWPPGLFVWNRKTTFHQFPSTLILDSVNFCKGDFFNSTFFHDQVWGLPPKKEKHNDIRYNKTLSKKGVELVIYIGTAWNCGTGRYFIVYLGLCESPLNRESLLCHTSIIPGLWEFFSWPGEYLESIFTNSYFIVYF